MATSGEQTGTHTQEVRNAGPAFSITTLVIQLKKMNAAERESAIKQLLEAIKKVSN